MIEFSQTTARAHPPQYHRDVTRAALTFSMFASLVFACHRPDGGELAPASRPPPPAPPLPAPLDPRVTPDATVPLDARVPLDASVRADAPRARDVGVEPAKKLGGHGAVCAFGARHPSGGGLDAPTECGPGLQCCYPCGIAGCDSVCHTPAECASDRQRP
ncbi:hypothetical protein BH11MYX1_BH11MYX1_28520 [soil metagenome]